MRRIATPQQPGTSGNGTAAAVERPGTKAQDHRNGSTNGSSKTRELRYEPSDEGVLLPAPVDGRGVTAMEFSMHAAAEIAQRVEGRSALRNQRTLLPHRLQRWSGWTSIRGRIPLVGEASGRDQSPPRPRLSETDDVVGNETTLRSIPSFFIL